MMTNGMQESVDKVATLEDVDVETFVAFSDSAYARLYLGAPAASQLNSASGTEPNLHISSWSYCKDCGSHASYYMNEQRTMIERRCGNTTCSPSPNAGFCIGCRLVISKTGWRLCSNCRSNHLDGLTNELTRLAYGHNLHGGNEKAGKRDKHGNAKYLSDEEANHFKFFLKNLTWSITPDTTLIDVARLYIFADRFMIERLPQVCLHNNHETLMTLQPTQTYTAVVVALAEYAYAYTAAADSQLSSNGGKMVGDLRDLVASYAASNAEELEKHEEFGAVLMGGGEFVKDFCSRLIAKR